MPTPDEHQTLQDLLGRALEADGPPSTALEAASSLFDFVDVDASLAQLIDSHTPALRASGIRQEAFAWDGVELTLQIDNGGDITHLVGDVTGAEVDVVHIVCHDGRRLQATCDLGSFETSISCVHLRLELDSPSGRLMTPWISTQF